MTRKSSQDGIVAALREKNALLEEKNVWLLNVAEEALRFLWDIDSRLEADKWLLENKLQDVIEQVRGKKIT